MKHIKLISREKLNAMANTTAVSMLTNNNQRIINKLMTDDYHGSDDFYKIEAKSTDDLVIAMLRMKLSIIEHIDIEATDYALKNGKLYITFKVNPERKQSIELVANILFSEIEPFFPVMEEKFTKLIAASEKDSTFSLNASLPRPK